MSGLALFGLAAVTLMLVFYTAETGCGAFCGYTASKWRQMASNPAVGTYSSSICKRLITSN